MARILCFDYGAKRVGIAVTDEQRIISSPLETYDTDKIFDFIDSYIDTVSYTHLRAHETQ